MSILVHELWHVALLHMLRRGPRDPHIWNCACDTVLDNMMDLDGYVVDERLFPQPMFPPGSKTFVDHKKYGTMSAEEIYDLMIKDPPPPSARPDSDDLIEPDNGDPTTNQAVTNAVVAAASAAKLAGKLPGQVQITLDKFLAPKLDWASILRNFFNEMKNQDYSWSRPNRRHQDVYLPSLVDDDGGLDHLIYYLDVSGSISEADIIRFHSEFKHVKETFQPKKMTMVQFDTVIQKEDVILEEDPFTETQVVGRGGTSLTPVREHIMEHNPTAVVIFSDLYCDVMMPLPPTMSVPIIWVCVNNASARVEQGTLIHIKEH